MAKTKNTARKSTGGVQWEWFGSKRAKVTPLVVEPSGSEEDRPPKPATWGPTASAVWAAQELARNRSAAAEAAAKVAGELMDRAITASASAERLANSAREAGAMAKAALAAYVDNYKARRVSASPGRG